MPWHSGQSTSSSWKPAPSSRIWITTSASVSVNARCTWPFSCSWACRTELEHASVSASLRSATASSEKPRVAQHAGERKPAEHDVLGLGRDVQFEEFTHGGESYRIRLHETTRFI